MSTQIEKLAIKQASEIEEALKLINPHPKTDLETNLARLEAYAQAVANAVIEAPHAASK